MRKGRRTAKRVGQSIIPHRTNIERKAKSLIRSAIKEKKSKIVDLALKVLKSSDGPVFHVEQVPIVKDAWDDFLLDLLMNPGFAVFELGITEGANTVLEALSFNEKFNSTTQAAERIMRDEGLELAKSVGDSMKDVVRGALADVLESGEVSVNTLKKAIADSIDGWMEGFQLERLARTEANRAMNLGAIEGYKQTDGLVTGKEWYAILDDVTAKECRALHGKVVGLDDKWELSLSESKANGTKYRTPPQHPNCRCVILPVMKSR